MIPFLFNENQFAFFVADHLQVGQLCTNPKSDSLLSCLKVTKCSTSKIGNVPLYNSCSLPIQLMTTGPLPAPSKCKSGLPRITGTCPGWWKQSFQLHQPTSPKRPRLGFRRGATTLYPSLTGPPPPRPEPAGLLRLVIRRDDHQNDLPQYQSQPDRCHPPSICWAPAGACGKACSQFWISIESVIEAEGGYIE